MVGWIIAAIVIAIVIAGLIKAVTIKEHQENNRPTIQQNNTSFRTNIMPSRSVISNSGPSETGPMIYYANDKHGLRDKEYKFNYKKVGSSWRAYILRTPSLGNRDDSGLITHRLFDNGRPYVCWDSDVTTLKDMQTVSRYWADCIQEYIATGKKF